VAVSSIQSLRYAAARRIRVMYSLISGKACLTAVHKF